MKKVIIMYALFISLKSAMAAGLINDMQPCQGLIDFIDSKLQSGTKYSESDVKKVQKGLRQYNDYIQQKIVSPGLLKFNNGDKSKASEMQKQVDAYKKTLVASFESRYTDDRIYSDQVLAINNCTKKAVPSGQALASLKEALITMVKLTKHK